MNMRIFDEPPYSELQEKILGLLEEAGIPTATNDQIIKLIDAAEWEQHRQSQEAQVEAEAKYCSERSPESAPHFSE